ncbi:MAG: hypothetical protein LUD01_10850 [Clostridiales bacterium]|nr:hypothetical protein [Clostridiales bacterium]
MGKLSAHAKRELEFLAQECVNLKKEGRPETAWLKTVYDRFRKTEGLSGLLETDELIYRKIYAAPPRKPSDTTKIRYWRTGRHAPSNRKLCLAFGHALELSEDEMYTLLMSWYDRSDLVFSKIPEEKDSLWKTYFQRMGVIAELTGEYLESIHPLRRMQLNVTPENKGHNLRHFYYMDARSFQANVSYEAVEKHIESVGYESEFQRQILLLGEIPRKVALRHLFLFGEPYLSRARVSDLLEELGYLPLEKNHTTVNGDRLDRLVIGFLELYEKQCAGLEPEVCSRWLREAYRYLDQYLIGQKQNGLRFLYFKTLGGKKGTAASPV